MRATRFAIWTALFSAAIFRAAASETPPACSVISQADVAELAGTPVAEGKAGVTERGVTSCSFAGEHGGQVTVLVRRVQAGSWRQEQEARMRRGAYREVQGIGDRAFLYTLRERAVLCVFGPEYYLQISLRRIEGGAPIESKLERLAAAALAQLGTARHFAMVRPRGR
jgi:hypothetical protein